jgi:formylmethanofuran dehydrogenase subunit E
MNNPFSSGYNMPDNCFSTPYDEKVRCHGCDEVFDEDDMIQDGDHYYCEDCYEEKLFEDGVLCDRCGKVVLELHTTKMKSGKFICDECSDDLSVEDYEKYLKGEL